MSVRAAATAESSIEININKRELVKKKIAVLLGGKSSERAISLRSGERVIAALEQVGAHPIRIDPIDEDWLDQMRGASIEIAFLALHGKGCEDGTIQGVLESFGFAYTGSGVLASALAMNKVMTKRILTTEDIPTADYYAITPDKALSSQCDEAADKLGFPMVIKPTSEGSSIGVSIVTELAELKRIATKTQDEFRDIFVEKYIRGKEITVGLIGVGNALRALPVLELVPKKQFYDYEAKYTAGMTDFILPARLSGETTKRVQDIAVNTHKVLGCHGYSRIDMLVGADDQPYVMEANTLPGLTDLSDLPAQADEAGISYPELLLEILSTALMR